MRRVATIESIGSSTRIEGSQLSDREVERLLANLEIQSFTSRDEQEVAGYAAVMEAIFHAWQEIPLTENHIKQLHRDLLQYSSKDDRHRGEYKKLPNNVAAFDDNGKQIAVLFETASHSEPVTGSWPTDWPSAGPTRAWRASLPDHRLPVCGWYAALRTTRCLPLSEMAVLLPDDAGLSLGSRSSQYTGQIGKRKGGMIRAFQRPYYRKTCAKPTSG